MAIPTLSLARRMQTIESSATLAILTQAKLQQEMGHKIINLSIGEPNFDTPGHIKAAAIQAIQDNHTKYTAVEGIPILKQAIIQKFAQDNHLNYVDQQILVSCGAKHSLYNALMAIINPHDEVIIPAPYWVSYPAMVKLAEGVPIIVHTHVRQQFKIIASQLRNVINPKTRALILNSPANPTGMVYTQTELTALAEVLLEHPRILIISDDIYEHHLWSEAPFMNILNACPQLYERCIIINGVSKAYAMTGWRIGYAAGSISIIETMKKIQSHSTSNPNSIAQYAAYAALVGSQQCVAEMAQIYKQRHDYLITALQNIPGINCLPAAGTFYLFPNIKAFLQPMTHLTNDVQFAEYLLHQAGLAVVPGSTFGAPDHIRICSTLAEAELVEAIEGLKHAIHRLSFPH